MFFPKNKLKGMIVICLIMAIIPFIRMGYHYSLKQEKPAFTNQTEKSVAIEIIDGNGHGGIYFFDQETTFQDLLGSSVISSKSNDNFVLKTGMKLILDSDSQKSEVTIGKMSPSSRLAIGLPMDINEASQDDLILIKGIGIATAERIVALREKLKRFDDVQQLTEIKGIKEKKIKELQQYLYVEK
ncbi:MAG: helix-hairpin-helix domain-containing protein [Smithella sp.]|nr:helix-hairpin-helix domain-containing protein [Smithella sp.]